MIVAQDGLSYVHRLVLLRCYDQKANYAVLRVRVLMLRIYFLEHGALG